jgi:hypothetical protein
MALITLSACGGGNAATTASTTSAAAQGKIDSAFIARVEAICRRANRRFAANGKFPFATFDPLHPDPKLLPKVGAYFRPNTRVEAMIEAKLRALGEPKRGAAKWDQLRDLVIANEQNAMRQARLAQASDAQGFVRTVRNAERLNTGIRAAGPAAGFSASSPCSMIF